MTYFTVCTAGNITYGFLHRSSLELLLSIVHALDSEEVLQHIKKKNNDDVLKKSPFHSKVSPITNGQITDGDTEENMTIDNKNKYPCSINRDGSIQSAISKVQSMHVKCIYFGNEMLPESASIRRRILMQDDTPPQSERWIVFVILLKISLRILLIFVMGSTMEFTMLVNFSNDMTRNLMQLV